MDKGQATWRAGRYAAIDIGTVTCRMLVADVDGQGNLTELDREYRITNLGEGVDVTGVLDGQAMRRVAGAVADYRAVLDDLGPTRLACVATSAARDARNAEEFAALLEPMGVRPTVIAGPREAQLSFRGASACFPGERLVVVDIGGGSTEVVAGLAQADPRRARSFDVGCRRVTEKFLASDPPAEQELGRAREWMACAMRPYFQELRDEGFLGSRLVAVAGTATTVVSVRDAMEVYDTARVHKARVTRADVDAVYGRLAALPLERRERVVGLDPGRGPVIVAGMAILQTVMDLAGAAEYTVSEWDILHGVVLEQARA